MDEKFKKENPAKRKRQTRTTPDIHDPTRAEHSRDRINKDSKILAANKKLFLELDDYNRRQGQSVATRDKILQCLLNLGRMSSKDMRKNTKKDIESLVDAILDRKEWSNRHKREHQKYIKYLYKWLNKSDEYPDLVKWIKPLKEERENINPQDYVTIEDIRKIGESEPDPRLRAFWFTLWETGMRVGTLATLKIGDVMPNEEGDSCILNMSRDTKSKTGKWPVPVFYFYHELVAWLKMHPDKNNPIAPLFPNRQYPGEYLCYQAIDNHWKAALKRCNIKRAYQHLHAIRHSSISWFAASGLLTQSELCMKYWGRSYSKEFSRYCHVDLNNALDKMRGKKKTVENPRPKTCVFCGTVNSGFEEVCTNPKCNKPLVAKTADQIQRRRLGLAEQLVRLLNERDPELLREIEKIDKGAEIKPAPN